MHRVLVREVVVDAPSHQIKAIAAYWAELLGAQQVPVPEHPEFIAPREPAVLMWIGLQQISEGFARFHLDIETDDVEAEVARLIRLGGTEQARHRSWVVMRDPAGRLLCIVPPQSAEFCQGIEEPSV